MYTKLGNFTANHPWLVVAGWLALAVALAAAAPKWDRRVHDDDIRFLPPRCDCVRGYRLLEQAFPQDVFASRIVFAFERDRALTVADLSRLRQDEPGLQIKKIYSHRDPFIGSRLVSDDRRCALIQVSLATPYLAIQTQQAVNRADEVVRARVAAAGAAAPAVFTTGPAGVGRDLINASMQSLDGTTLVTVLLVIAILLMVYRSPVLALVPLASIAVAVWVALNVLSLCTLIPGFYIIDISRVFAVVMLYGAGTDYCLFLISRYREELAQGHAAPAALGRSLGGVGGALAASAGTVICGLGLMATAEFTKVRCGGPAIAVGLGVALLSSLTLTPALLRLLGKSAFWPTRPPVARQGEAPEGVWGPISRFVVTRPLLVGGAAVALLAPLALLGLQVKPSYRATAELGSSSSSVRGLAAIQRHFTAGEVGPVTVLVESPSEWDTEEGRRVVDHMGRVLAALPNVAEVRSLTRPLGKPADAPRPEQKPAPPKRGPIFSALLRNVAQGVNDRVARATRAHYLGRVAEGGSVRHVTRLDVVLHTDPFDPRSAETLGLVQLYLRMELPYLASSLGEARAECYGITVNARDLAEVTERDRRRINWLVLGGIFAILLVLVRRPGLAAYLLATVLLSYFATLGATAVLAHVWHGRPAWEVDWRVPFFLFTILVAVGEDYNILLIARAMEEREKYGGVEGTRRALAHTGGTITSCGLIMAGTFATLMLAGLNTLVQVGFALAFGVLLDTFIVRPLLVPAFTVLVWGRQDARERAAPGDAAGRRAA
jgi:RND superfamily putative drug exporter